MHTLSLSNASLAGFDEGATGTRRDSLDGLSAITRSVVFSQLVKLLPYFRDSRLRMCWGEGWKGVCNGSEKLKSEVQASTEDQPISIQHDLGRHFSRLEF